MKGLAAAAIFIASAASAQTLYKIGGTVLSTAGPLSGATVTIDISSIDNRPLGHFVQTTGADGRFSVMSPGGGASIQVEPPAGSGLQPLHTGFYIIRDLEATLTLVRPARISGFVVADSAPTEILLHGLLFEPTYSNFTNDVNFSQDVVPGRYMLLARRNGRFYARQFVDVRADDAANVSLTLSRDPISLLPDGPPVASRIHVSAAGDDGMATVRGDAGAVSGIGTVFLLNPQTSQMNLAISEADGSFSMPMFAPAGAFLEIKFDPSGHFLPPLANGGNPSHEHPPGTIIHVPLAPAAGGAQPFAVMGWIDYYGALDDRPSVGQLPIYGYVDPGQYVMSGSIDPSQWKPGATFTLRGTLQVYSKDLAADTDISRITASGSVILEREIDAAAGETKPVLQFLSTSFTPTGLPIERLGFGLSVTPPITVSAFRRLAADRLEADWSAVVTLPPDLRPGVYRPIVRLGWNGMPPHVRHHDVLASAEASNESPALPLMRVGDAPPRLVWMLALDDFTNGHRGSVALEDRGRFQFASHVVTSSDVLILPKIDERTRQPIRYRLEPFLPMVGSSPQDPAPRIAFRFPSGQLHVRVFRPSGTIDDLGTAAFAQSRVRTALTVAQNDISGREGKVSNHIANFYQLTTLDPRFDYAFSEYGRHRIEMTGFVDDEQGIRHSGGGTYEIDVARPLDVETATMVGTPFEAGNSFQPSLVVQPPVPADIDLRLTLMPDSDPAKAITRSIHGRANRYGIFTTPDTISLNAAGEYRVDIDTRWAAPDGTLWAAHTTWGSIVETPNSPLVTHGRRGFDGLNVTQNPWFSVRTSTRGSDHVMFPFHAGDVQWMEQLDPAAAIPKITVQDNPGAFADRVRKRASKGGAPFEQPSLEERIAQGEIPLFSTTKSNRSANFDAEGIEQWGYFYAFAERPGVRVRELITEDDSGTGYWRFHDLYHFQLGTGANGDLPNDFKFQFGGAVWRESDFRYYGAYASLFVLIPNNDPDGGRVFPPFQGNVGPSGGPLFRLKGKPIDLFFHPTAVRAGSILERAARVTFAGYVAPPRAGKIDMTITAPSGTTRTIRGQANWLGYFYDPAQDFIADESGVWKVKIKVTYDGQISAGQLQAPFPVGDVLGSREGEFYFYVVDGSAPSLTAAPMPQFVRPAAGPITLSIAQPSGLHDVQLTYTTVMPGFVLEEGTSSTLSYTYDATRLARDFPNLDLNDPDGFAGADTITISLLVSGTDAAGKRRHFARQIVLQGEELQMPEQPPAPPPPRRRAAR